MYQIGGQDPIFGRIGEAEIVRQFRQRGVGYVVGKPQDAGWYDANGFDFVYWGWERNGIGQYRSLFEAKRKFTIVIFAQEQPQQLEYLRQVAPFGDVVITSSPVYRNEADYFVPFGVHDIKHCDRLDRNRPRKRAVLISGSYRHSRGQLFDWLLGNQPFDWPVYYFPTCLSHDMVERDLTRQIVSRYPKYCYPAAFSLRTYIAELMQHLLEHELFVDFTTNSTNYLKFHEDLSRIFEQGRELQGGYCPERVLDALWLECYPFCFSDEAVRHVLSDHVGYYNDLDDLSRAVNAEIRDGSHIEKAKLGSRLVERFRTSNIISVFADFYKCGTLKEISMPGGAPQ